MDSITVCSPIESLPQIASDLIVVAIPIDFSLPSAFVPLVSMVSVNFTEILDWLKES